MGEESWLSRIKKNREIRRTERLQKRFEFLINEINNSQDRTVAQLIDQENNLLNKKSEQLENRIINSLDSLETQFSERSVGIIEHMTLLKGEQQERKNEIMALLDVIMKKLEMVEESNQRFQENSKELVDEHFTIIREKIIKSEEKISSIVGENSSYVQKKIEHVQTSGGEQFDEIHRVLKSIISKIEVVQNNKNEMVEKYNEIVEDKSNSILLSIDEVKALMKIIAVNNLLDEV